MNIYVYGIILLISFLVSYFSVPLAIKFAVKHGIIDNPKKDDRRVHKKPTPRAGRNSYYYSYGSSITYLLYTITFL